MLDEELKEVDIETVVVCGLGTIGVPTAQYIKEKKFEVYGYDIKPKDLQGVETYTEWKKVPNAEAYVIAVSTGWNNDIPDIASLLDVCKKISNKNDKSLVSIESTVPPGTCKWIATQYNLEYVVYVPHRYWVGDTRNHGVRQKRVIGAINCKSLERGLAFYEKLNIPLHVCPNIEVAEMSKIAENTDRFIQIAYVQELRMVCETMGLPFQEVRKASNTKWNVELLEARDGIDGDCLPMAIRYLRSLSDAETQLLAAAISSNSLYKLYSKKMRK